MKQRCHNPDARDYFRYGFRGIYVCDRWRNSFDAFLADMGKRPAPHLSLERIDNDGPYCIENCRWATKREQARNRRSNRLITANERTQTLAEWAEETGIAWFNIEQRIRKLGWTPERAVSEPVRPHHWLT